MGRGNDEAFEADFCNPGGCCKSDFDKYMKIEVKKPEQTLGLEEELWRPEVLPGLNAWAEAMIQFENQMKEIAESGIPTEEIEGFSSPGAYRSWDRCELIAKL